MDDLREKIIAILRYELGTSGDDEWGHEVTGIEDAADEIVKMVDWKSPPDDTEQTPNKPFDIGRAHKR